MILIVGGTGQGQLEFARSMTSEEHILADYHLEIREKLMQGETPERLIRMSEERVMSHPQLVITMDEVGCGIVPMEAFEREYRECCGRVSCVLAQKADAVYRMICGIPQKIK